MKVSAITFSDAGDALAAKIAEALKYSAEAGELAANSDTATLFDFERCEKGGLSTWVDENFASSDALLFIGACGIAVRAIAGHVQHKTSDPAVVVMDDGGTFAISLLSGHIGGANALATSLAAIVGAIPVITTATDVNGVFAIDTWAKANGLLIMNPERIVDVSAALLADKRVRLINEFYTLGNLPHNLGFFGAMHPTVHITFHGATAPGALHLVPPVLTLGIGCKKGTSEEAIEAAVSAALSEADIVREAICQVASIDVKANEQGLLSWCERNGLPFKTFSAEELLTAKGSFNDSEFVEKTVGVGNVCERAAVVASDGVLVSGKFSHDGATCAFAQAPFSAVFRIQKA